MALLSLISPPSLHSLLPPYQASPYFRRRIRVVLIESSQCASHYLQYTAGFCCPTRCGSLYQEYLKEKPMAKMVVFFYVQCPLKELVQTCGICDEAIMITCACNHSVSRSIIVFCYTKTVSRTLLFVSNGFCRCRREKEPDTLSSSPLIFATLYRSSQRRPRRSEQDEGSWANEYKRQGRCHHQ